MNEYGKALKEFHYIASHTTGRSGSTQDTDNGYQFTIFLEEEDEIPSPRHEYIRTETYDRELDGEDYIMFIMILPYMGDLL